MAFERTVQHYTKQRHQPCMSRPVNIPQYLQSSAQSTMDNDKDVALQIQDIGKKFILKVSTCRELRRWVAELRGQLQPWRLCRSELQISRVQTGALGTWEDTCTRNQNQVASCSWESKLVHISSFTCWWASSAGRDESGSWTEWEAVSMSTVFISQQRWSVKLPYPY